MADFLAITSNILLFVLVFGMSATVNIECMQEQIRNKRALATGIVCQFVILPLLGFLTVNALDLDPDIGLTLLIVTSSPGGSYSNWYVKGERGCHGLY
jgi:predicted Na+-dependent transporter